MNLGSSKRNLIESFVIAVVLTGVSYLVGIWFGWVDPSSLSYLEAFAVFTSYSCTYLCVKERRINYPIGAISTAAYAVLFFQQGLVASMLLNIYLTPSLIYGWFRWRSDAQARPVTRVALKWVPVYLVVTALAYLGAVGVASAFGGTLALTDSVILIGTVLAQFLLDNKKIENWIIWAVVNVFAIYTYATAGLALAAFQYVFFLLNTIYGFICWQRSKNNGEIVRVDDSTSAHAGALAPDSVQ